MHPLLIKVYAYQLFRGLNYLSQRGVVHRDIKPQNLLVDPGCHALKICDFGSAKKIKKDDKNIAYTCSRYYRAPELLFGSRYYSFPVDMWAAGCVLAELFLGSPLFKGENSG